MNTLLAILTFLGTFAIMEFMAWFIHKYIMHGVLWVLHKDHHQKDHDSWFERNDAFFLFFAEPQYVLFNVRKRILLVSNPYRFRNFSLRYRLLSLFMISSYISVLNGLEISITLMLVEFVALTKSITNI
jgi:hypothetical protein